MELSTVAQEIYGLPLEEFTSARNARASEVRRGGDRDVADAVKRLRKPSTGAWIVNRLAREQPREIESLIELGTGLRSKHPDGARIRQATKEKSEILSKLLRQAKSLAKRADVPFSPAVEAEIEGTLDAAFSDSDSAHLLCEGCLTTGLHYSGLGFGADAGRETGAGRARKGTRGNAGPTTAERSKARDDLQQARREAKQADSEVEHAQRAVKTAETDLQRLRAALTVARRQATKAHEKVAGAQKKIDPRGGDRRRV